MHKEDVQEIVSSIVIFTKGLGNRALGPPEVVVSFSPLSLALRVQRGHTVRLWQGMRGGVSGLGLVAFGISDHFPFFLSS